MAAGDADSGLVHAASLAQMRDVTMSAIRSALPFMACASVLSIVACAGGGTESVPRAPAATATVDWREIATAHDRQRIRQWRTAWVQALAKAQAGGHGGDIAAEGALLAPDAALPWQPPPEGLHRCRVTKIGSKGSGMLDYVAYPPFDCRLRAENGLTSFAKLTGSQRPLGLILPDSDRRSIFLGTLQLGDEKLALQYGRDRERDMAALVERIGDARWRMVFPYPHFESTIDVLELVPAG